MLEQRHTGRGRIAEQPLAVWAERFDAAGVWWAPAQSPAEVVADPQFVDGGGLVTIDGGPERSVAGPVRFDGVDTTALGPVPALGQHTAEVLD